jgi:hypothetical protein
MKIELAAITSALGAIGVQKKGGKGKPPRGAPSRGPRKPPSGRRGRRRTHNRRRTRSSARAGLDKVLQLPPMGAAHRCRVHEDASGVQQAHGGCKVATVWTSEGLSV